MFNVQRDKEIPQCLENKDLQSVLDILKKIFFGKCYLCEDTRFHPEIEHLDPHQGDDEKQYDWNNLYYACRRCNGIKGIKYKNILDCCNDQVDVFRAIQCSMPSTFDQPIVVKSTGQANQETKNTVELLDACYNKDNTPSRKLSKKELKNKLFDYYSDLLKYRTKLRYIHSTPDEAKFCKDKIKRMLHDEYPFSVFWKWFVLKDEYLIKQLGIGEDIIF